MRKVISLIILIVLLFTNIAYPLTVLRPPIGKDKKRTKKAVNAAVYLKLARWINENIGNEGDIKTIVAELKGGKLVFEYTFEEPVFKYKSEESDDVLEVDFEGGFYSEFKVDFVRGFYSTYEPMDRRFDYSYERIPENVPELPSEILKKAQRSISEYGIDYLNQNNVNLISSIGEAWELKFKLDEKITERIVRCLRSLGRNALTSGLSKKIITKKLLKLQQKIPKATPIIRENALELLEIDEVNFREGLEPFIIDYIALRDAIRRIGIKDDTAKFYNLFDEIVAWMQTGQHEEEFLASMEFIEKIPDNFTVSAISLIERKPKALRFVDYDMWLECYNFKKLYGGFRAECEYTPEGTLSVYDWGATLNAGHRRKLENQGRFSVYPEPIPMNKKTDYLIRDINNQDVGYSVKTIKDKKIKRPASAIIYIYPKTNPAKPLRKEHKDLKKTYRSQV